MLQGARERATSTGVAITFYEGDFRQLRFEPIYDFIFVPTGTFMHLLTRADAEDFLSGVRRALTPRGIVAIDVYNPTMSWLKALPLPTTPKETTFQHRRTHEHISVTTTTDYQADRQVVTQRHRYTFADGTERESAAVLKLYFPVELEALLYYNGFTIQQAYGSYAREPFTAQSVKQILLVRPTRAA
jgi:hypothetical protein